jgi:hypothetical protein
VRCPSCFPLLVLVLVRGRHAVCGTVIGSPNIDPTTHAVGVLLVPVCDNVGLVRGHFVFGFVVVHGFSVAGCGGGV